MQWGGKTSVAIRLPVRKRGVSSFNTGMRSDRAYRWTHFQLRGVHSKCPMRPLLVVVPHELGQYRPQMLLVQQAVIWTFGVKRGLLACSHVGAVVTQPREVSLAMAIHTFGFDASGLLWVHVNKSCRIGPSSNHQRFGCEALGSVGRGSAGCRNRSNAPE